MILSTDDDLDLARIATSGQCFRWTQAGDGAWRIIYGRHCVYATGLGEGSFRFECSQSDFDSVWHPYLDLGESYVRIRARIDQRKDPFLHEAAQAGKGIRILRQDPWETLVSFIISQNRNIPAIQRSIEFLSQKAGEKLVDSRGDAYWAFPTAHAVAELDMDALLACKLGYRAKYVAAAARAVAGGEINLEALRDADEPDTIAELTRLYGVGVKVASCVSLFGLHHLDAFPVDVWIKRVLEHEYPHGYPIESYRPYNGVFQQYMFAYYRDKG